MHHEEQEAFNSILKQEGQAARRNSQLDVMQPANI
jgi:hypothetical protein